MSRPPGDRGCGPRRIWHLSSNRWNSAITEYALSAARSLTLQGHACTFTPLKGSPAEERARRHLDTRPLRRFTLGGLGELRSLARRIRPDAVIAYGGPETFLTRFLEPAFRPVMVAFRGRALETHRLAFRLRHRLARSHVNLILTPARWLAEEVAPICPGRPVRCVPLGCDTRHWQPVFPAMPPARPEIVMLGRLDPVKGHARMMRLMALLLREWPDDLPRPLLHVVGEPANLSAAHVEELARREGLTPGIDVRLTTRRVPELPPVLTAATLGVVPSLGSEVICRVAQEFLLCGTPVVVSGAGSLDEVLFEEAGAGFRGLDDSAAAALVAGWLRRGFRESRPERERRAGKAKALFSLEAMGRDLDEALQAVARPPVDAGGGAP